jgi:transcriptional regulator with XRE-family HTH domain
MPESFGARLRQRREERQIPLTSIADETKIKLALLEGLERDDVSHWPSGIFRRAYLRAYAHMIGFDPDEALREFLEVYPDPADAFEAAAVALATAGDPSRRSGPPTRLRNMVDSAIGSLARLRRPAGADDASPQQGTRFGVRPQPDPGPVGAEAPVPAVAAAPLEADPFEETTFPNPEQVDQPVLAVATTSISMPAISVPALLKPVSADAAPAAAPTEHLAFNPPVRVSSPAPLPETVVVEPVEQMVAPPVVAAVAPPAAPVEDAPPAPSHDLDAIAGLCTALARVMDRNEIQQLLQEAARELKALGIIIWTWDAIAEELQPALVHGYSSRVLAQLPPVRRDADNATAAAFRSGQTREMRGGSGSSGALVVPLLTPDGCAGVLAIELQPGAGNTRSSRAVATILAAVLGQLAVRLRVSDAQPRPQPERVSPATGPIRSPVRPMRVRR